MDWLAIGIMALGTAEQTGDPKSDSMNLIARMPELMARVFLLRGGKKEQLRPENQSLDWSRTLSICSGLMVKKLKGCVEC